MAPSSNSKRGADGDTGAAGRQPKPAWLPQIGWLSVRDLQVDYAYQHDSYAWAVEEILVDFRPELSGMILVNIRADGRMFIIDGATRREVRLRRGEHWILAEIMRGLTQQQEAEAYLVKAQNKQRQPIDWFVAEVAAGKPQSKMINDILNARGIHVQSYATRRKMVVPPPKAVVSCVKALKRIAPHDSDGSALLDTLDLVLDTWGYDKSVLAGEFLLCIAGILAKPRPTRKAVPRLLKPPVDGAAPTRPQWSLHARLEALGYTEAVTRAQRIKLGQAVAQAYRERHGQPPPVEVSGHGDSARRMAVYEDADLPLLDAVIRDQLGAPPAATALEG
jgi:hypothetical protein